MNEVSKLASTSTGGSHFMLGVMVHLRGIEPLIYTCETMLSSEVKICSVSTKLAAFPSSSRPRTKNLRPGLRPGLRQSFLEISLNPSCPANDPPI